MRSLPRALGYDPRLVQSLTPGAQRQIRRIAEGLMFSALLLSSPAAYAAFLVEHSLFLSVTLGCALWLTFLNMLRLVTAGGGAAAHLTEERVRTHRPALGASVVLAVLAFVLAQPAQLPLYRGTLDGDVAAERSRLVAQHERSLSTLGAPADRAFEQRLARCDFLVLRLRKVWEKPARALWWSTAYVLVVLFPALFARFVALSALREYELARFRQTRAVVRQATAQSEAERDALLAAYPDYVRRAPSYADPPFNTRIASPLMMPVRRRDSSLLARAWRRWRGR